MSTITGVKHNIRKKLTYYSQFSSNSNKILHFIFKNLILKPSKTRIFFKKILKKLFHQEWWHRTKLCVGPSLAASLQPLAHRWNVASWSISYGYYFGRFLSQLTELVSLPHSCGSSTCYYIIATQVYIRISGFLPFFSSKLCTISTIKKG